MRSLLVAVGMAAGAAHASGPVRHVQVSCFPLHRTTLSCVATGRGFHPGERLDVRATLRITYPKQSHATTTYHVRLRAGRNGAFQWSGMHPRLVAHPEDYTFALSVTGHRGDHGSVKGTGSVA